MAFGGDGEHALAYVLRLWCVTNGEARYWRASLQDMRTGERHGFADLDGACRYLRGQIEIASGGPPGREAPREDVAHGG